ncbi:MAG: DUF881 domain-containing protein [Nocardioides sp.]|uniref:DUF881 domain-containing protein n=1 Tax=Nocardioides sp. TaxID=35761 RepID=UPI0039E47897
MPEPGAEPHVEPHAEPGGLPAAVTMPLLTKIIRQSLDEDYRHVAERRRAHSHSAGQAAGSAAGPPRKRLLTVATVLVFGLLVTIAGIQTARTAGTRQASREVLISRITDRKEEITALHRRIGRLTDQNTASESLAASLADQLRRAENSVGQLGRSTGFAAVSGPGVRITVNDATSGAEGTQVRDSDLNTLVNGLWAAGATAISVDGERITPKSAFRNSGSVIRINSVSLSPPYVVQALGDTKTLQARLAQTTSGAEFHTLTTELGIGVVMENVDDLTLPAAPADMMDLSYASSATTDKSHKSNKSGRTGKTDESGTTQQKETP